MLKKSRLGFLICFVLAILATACSTGQVDENDPASLYKDAEAEIQSDHYQIAVEKLRTIKNKFPYSKFATEAHLKIGDVYFLQESFAEAASVYEAFRDLHPKHEKTPYAMFRIGKSYFNDTPGAIARDMTPAYKAVDAYTEFLQRFPNAPEAPEAKKDVEKIRGFLAEKELYIANFYLKRDFYESAKPRFKKVLELYSETEAAKTAEEKLSIIDEKLKAGGSDKNDRDYRKSE